jgi:hypothetical protein
MNTEYKNIIHNIYPFSLLEDELLNRFVDTYINDITSLNVDVLKKLSGYIALFRAIIVKSSIDIEVNYLLRLSRLSNTLSDVQMKVDIDIMKDMTVTEQIKYIMTGVLPSSLVVDIPYILNSPMLNLIYYIITLGSPISDYLYLMPHPLMQIKYKQNGASMTPLALYRMYIRDPSYDEKSYRFQICRILNTLWSEEFNSPVLDDKMSVPYPLLHTSINNEADEIYNYVGFTSTNRYTIEADVLEAIRLTMNTVLRPKSIIETLTMGYRIAPLTTIDIFRSYDTNSLQSYVNAVVNRWEYPESNLLMTVDRTVEDNDNIQYNVNYSRITYTVQHQTSINRNDLYNNLLRILHIGSHHLVLLLRGQTIMNRTYYTQVLLMKNGWYHMQLVVVDNGLSYSHKPYLDNAVYTPNSIDIGLIEKFLTQQ